jgi:hypothetical protein
MLKSVCLLMSEVLMVCLVTSFVAVCLAGNVMTICQMSEVRDVSVLVSNIETVYLDFSAV